MSIDLFLYRTAGEIDMVSNLAAISADDTASLRGRFGVNKRALCLARPLHRMEFRFLRKDGNYWMECSRG